MPIYEDEVLSFLAYSLNSPQYMKNIYREEGSSFFYLVLKYF